MERTGPVRADPAFTQLDVVAPTFRKLRDETQLQHNYDQSRWLRV